jgi:hypothetical protein
MENIDTATTSAATAELAPPVDITPASSPQDVAAAIAHSEAAVKAPAKKAPAKKAPKKAPVKKAPKAPKVAKAKRVAGVKAQGQVTKEAFRLLKALAKEKGVRPAQIVTLAVHRFVGFKPTEA